MKLRSLAALTIVFGLVATALYLFADAHTIGALASDPSGLILANPALLALRTEHADLVKRAADKIKEIVAGMAPEAAKRIEDEHAELLRQVADVETRIRTEETRAATPPAPTAHAWSTEDIGRIQARATAFGLTPTDALAVIGDASVRTVEAATDKLQDILAKRAPSRQDPHVRISQDEGDTLRRSVESAILLRANPRAFAADAPEIELARNFRGMSLLEIGREFLSEAHGVRLRGLSRMEQAGACLGLLHQRAGMMSSSDFAHLLSNVVSKRLRDTYKQSVQTWRPFCRQNNAPDFKERAIVQLNGMPDLLKVREGQEYSYAKLGDAVEKYAIATYGRIIPITRQTLINDDLGAFDRLPTLFGRAAAEFESDTVWGIIIQNRLMGDGVVLFHEDHGNLAEAGGDPSEATVEAGDIAMGEQKDGAGKPMNLTPKFLAVSRKHKVKAQKLLTSVQATQTGDVNVYQNSMDLIVEDRLHKALPADKSPWLLIGDPAQWDTIEYAYLEGEEGLYTEERVGFNVDGIEIKGRLDFGAAPIDFRAFYLNPGN